MQGLDPAEVFDEHGEVRGEPAPEYYSTGAPLTDDDYAAAAAPVPVSASVAALGAGEYVSEYDYVSEGVFLRSDDEWLEGTRSVRPPLPSAENSKGKTSAHSVRITQSSQP